MATTILPKQQQLLDFLVSKKLLTKEQTAEIVADIALTRKPLDQAIVDKGGLDQETYVKAHAEFLGLPYVDLRLSKIEDEVLNVVSAEVAENYKVVCFERADDKIRIGFIDPDNLGAQEAIDFLAKGQGVKVEYCLISPESFSAAAKQYRRITKEISTALETKAKEEESEKTQLKKVVESNLKFDDAVKNAPIAKIISVIIQHAAEVNASDIHIEPLPKETRVRYRIDGILHNFLVLPKDISASLVSRVKVLANLKLDETRIPQDGRIRLNVNGKDIDFRISILPLMGEEKVVMRILDPTKGLIKLENLGFVGRTFDVIMANTKKTGGMILVTGPTGSGKSTTLYAVLNMVNREAVNIVTLEDPVEYFIKGINQSQVRPEIDYTFATGLRSILRQDPDVIMVGEVRDKETADLSVQSALTGHLVLSTLHTKDAIGAVPRLLDMGIEPFLLTSVLDIVVAQRLARRICPDCKQEQKISGKFMDDMIARIKLIPENLVKKIYPEFDAKNIKLYKGVGCVRCGNTGYVSRVCIAEVLEVNDLVKDAILNRHGMMKAEEIVASQEFMTIEQDGLVKAMQGITTLEEVFRVMQN